MRRYGLTLEDYEKMLEEIGYECPICSSSHFNKPLVVDHNHLTLEVRGLICHNCNSGIGFLRDCPNLLQKALQYLKFKTHENISKS